MVYLICFDGGRLAPSVSTAEELLYRPCCTDIDESIGDVRDRHIGSLARRKASESPLEVDIASQSYLAVVLIVNIAERERRDLNNYRELPETRSENGVRSSFNVHKSVSAPEK